MQLDILTPEKTIYSGEASSVTVPGTDGSLGILNDHAPLISSLKEGDIVVQTPKGEEKYVIGGGVVEVMKNKVIVLAE